MSEHQQSALRSAKDFESESTLRSALEDMEAPMGHIWSQQQQQQPQSASSSTTGSALDGNMDWILPNGDSANSFAQTIDQEVRRLKALVSYMVLDAEPEPTFDRLTKMAARVFGVAMAQLNLVDLGRVYKLSMYGTPGASREDARNSNFCSHALLAKEDVFVVEDATQDERFCDNPIVTGELKVRFYAAAPLVAMDGYRLGSFCIVDTKPRPGGLTARDKRHLMDFAEITMKYFADRRQRQDEDPSRLVACTAHDLLTPLSGVLLSLSMLKEDGFEGRLNEHQKDCIATATRSSEMMLRICQTTIETLRKTMKGDVVDPDAPVVAALVEKTKEKAVPCIDIREFVKSLHMIIDPIPKRVPLVITVDSCVPLHIVSDDLKIFRSSLNLLSNACRITETGSIRFRMFIKNDFLVFECEDSAKDIDIDDRELLFHPHKDDSGVVEDLGLYSLAAQIDSLGGEYGFRPRGEREDGTTMLDTKGRKVTGSVFWFSIPVIVPTDMPRPSSKDGITHLSGIRSVESFASCAASRSSNSVDTTSAMSRQNSGILAITSAAARSLSGSNSCLDSIVRTLSASSFKPGQPVRGTVNSTWENKDSSKPMNIDILKIRKALESAGATKRSQSPPPFSKSARSSDGPVVKEALLNMQASLGASAKKKLMNKDPRQKKALVIEDSLVVRKTLARALQKLGYQVSQAVDGMEGLKELKREIFDISLCDFLMPNMDGLDCVQQYRQWEKKNRPSYRQYIVGISAHAGHNDITKGLEIGMNDFKAKPITIKILTELHESAELMQVRATLDEAYRVGDDTKANLSLKLKKQKIDSDPMLCSSLGLSVPSILLRSRSAGTKRAVVDLSRSNHGGKTDSSVDSSIKPSAKKKAKISEDFEPAEKVCLIATETSSNDSESLARQMKENGWKVTMVHDGNNVLTLLKQRNWGAVLLDDEIPNMSGTRCVSAFRDWELKNRVCRQNNLFLVCSSGLPSPLDPSSVVQPPCGFDGALDTPVLWKDVKYLLKKSKSSESQHRGGLKIVTR